MCVLTSNQQPPPPPPPQKKKTLCSIFFLGQFFREDEGNFKVSLVVVCCVLCCFLCCFSLSTTNHQSFFLKNFPHHILDDRFPFCCWFLYSHILQNSWCVCGVGGVPKTKISLSNNLSCLSLVCKSFCFVPSPQCLLCLCWGFKK